jgi:antitoxin MazE
MNRKIITIGKRGVLYMPKEILREFHLNEGDFIEAYGTNDGIVLKPKALVDKDQAWFWADKWQKEEREVDEDIKRGRMTKVKGVDAAIKHLRGLKKK